MRLEGGFGPVRSGPPGPLGRGAPPAGRSVKVLGFAAPAGFADELGVARLRKVIPPTSTDAGAEGAGLSLGVVSSAGEETVSKLFK